MGAKSFSYYYSQCFVRSGKTFESLLNDKRQVRFGTYAVVISAILYTLVYIFLYFGGGLPFKPWLSIPPEQYYSYNIFFLAPSMFASWILAAGVVQSLSRLFGGKGNFENALSVLGFGISVASWSTGLHDLISSFLGAIKIIDQNKFEAALNSATIWRTILWVLMIIYLVWFVVLFYNGIKATYRLKAAPTLLLAVIGFITYQLLFFVFNR